MHTHVYRAATGTLPLPADRHESDLGCLVYFVRLIGSSFWDLPVP